jgi:hypothetical protein
MRIDFIKTPGYLVTLTYPQEWPESSTANYGALKQFWHGLSAFFGDELLGLLWRKEYQRRGAPHFHCLLMVKTPAPLHLVRSYVRREWTLIVGEYLTKGRYVRTRVDELKIDQHKGAGALYHYLSSYVAKTEQGKLVDKETGEILPTGRMWGVLGEIPFVEGFHVEMMLKDCKTFCRRIRRWGRQRKYLAGFTIERGWTLIFCPEAVARQLVRGLGEQAPDTS